MGHETESPPGARMHTYIDVRSTAADPFLFSARRYVDNGDHDTGYPVHRCVCESVYICICVSCGVPGCILGIESDFGGTPGL